MGGTYTDLEVWQAGMKLAVQIYRITVGSQIRRHLD